MRLIVPKKVQEVELFYSDRNCCKEKVKITCSEDAYKVFKANWSKQIGIQEEFNILLIDRANHVLGFCNLSKGGICSTIVDLKIAFMAAIKGRASSIIMGHNHPSGNLKPSSQDIELTKKFKKAGELLEICVLDHIILSTGEGYYSFADDHNL